MTEMTEILALDNEVKSLRRQLAETEARVLAKTIELLEQNLESKEAIALTKKLKEHPSLDLLELERVIAQKAKDTAEMYKDIVEAAQEFKHAKNDFDDISTRFWLAEQTTEKKEQYKDRELKMIRKRELLFSLIAEMDIRDSYAAF